jgi:glycosyltransferase involved in cell wall biosynthesis
MRLGVAIQETWGFFNEIYADFQKRYDVSVFDRRVWNLPVLRSRVNDLLYRHDLKQFMSKNDVVFFEWASELLVVATHLPKVSRIVTRLHRYEMYQWVDRVNWDLVDKIIVVSHAKKAEFQERFPAQAGKIIVSGPSTSLERFTPCPKTYGGDIGILCHLTPRKRVYDLIVAFYSLLQQRGDFHLHIGGGMDPAFQDYYYALHSIVDDLGLRDKVTFYGNIQDTPAWYKNIDIFISNSYSEGLQVAPMEAMASGCYCLSHHWRGADELLPEENLYYTDEELIHRILDYCRMSDTQKQEQRKRMREWAEKNFDIDQTIKQVVQAIEEAAKVTSVHSGTA